MNTELKISELKKLIEDKSSYDFQINEDQCLSIINDEYEQDKQKDIDVDKNRLRCYDLDECSIQIRYRNSQSQETSYNTSKLSEYKIELTQEQLNDSSKTDETLIFDGDLWQEDIHPGHTIFIFFNNQYKDFDSVKFQFLFFAKDFYYQAFRTDSTPGSGSNKMYYCDVKNPGFYYRLILRNEFLVQPGTYFVDVLDPEGNLMFGRRIIKPESGTTLLTTNGYESRLPFCHIEDHKAYIPSSIPLEIWTMGKADYKYEGYRKVSENGPAFIDIYGEKYLSIALETEPGSDTFMVMSNYKAPELNTDLQSMFYFIEGLTPWTDMISRDKYFLVKENKTTIQAETTIKRASEGVNISKYETIVPYDFDCQPNNCRRNWGKLNKWYSLLCDGVWTYEQDIALANCVEFNRERLHWHLDNYPVYYSKKYLDLIN